MTIKDALNKAIDLLKKSNIENAIQISKIVLANFLKRNKEYILMNENEILLDEVYNKYIEGIDKISNGIPMQYITNVQEFMGMDFFVDENVLIPQPDTEILVEEVLSIIGKKENLCILDICTGSGAIAVSIAKNTNNCIVYAVDISKNAIEVAKKNAIKNGVNEKITFVNSNMFEKVDSNKKFDIIVSNPPYIKTEVIEELNKDVRQEPKLALDGGEDGLKFYRAITENAYKYLNNDGYLCLEIGENQKEEVMELLKSNNYQDIYCKKDLAGNDRVIIAKYR